MSILVVVNNPTYWPLQIPGVTVVRAKEYLADAAYSKLRGAKVFNLCRSYRYQSLGYYVSLVAEARGHRPQPSIQTIQDLKSPTILRLSSDDLNELIQKSLSVLRHAGKGDQFTLSIYFGRNLAKRYARLSLALFNLFPAPMLRATFIRGDDEWELRSLEPFPASEIPESHRPFAIDAASAYFENRRWTSPKREAEPYELAILWDAEEAESPSDEKAIKRFVKAAQKAGMGTEIIGRDDYGRLAEFDALFIRQTTSVNHHTFRFAARAAAEGLVVIDDPDSILKCTNKVYLQELLERWHIRTPKSLIVHNDNVDRIVPELGLPCVLKQPDSSFSQGVIKVKTEAELRAECERLLDKSDLIIAQQYLPTDFDWRVGVLDGEPLYVCKYYMARDHWQIIKRGATGRSYGRIETLAVEEAPYLVIATAVKAAEAVGNGLYGVDLKQVERRCYVMEVNDNPNIDAGYEDEVLKDKLYQRIMDKFVYRLREMKEGVPRRG